MPSAHSLRILTGLPALVASALASTALPATAAQPLQYVPVASPPLSEPVRRKRGLFGLFGKKSKSACVDVANIAGAIVTDDRTIELHMHDGQLWRMRFRTECPALSYYQGFYYRRSQASKLCAGRDAVMARSGGGCLIDSLARDKSGGSP